MDRKIFKTGHSLAVTLSKQLLGDLGLKLGDNVKIELDKNKDCLVLSPQGHKHQLALNINSRLSLGGKAAGK